MAHMTVRCSFCGATLMADSEEEMIKVLQDHAMERHNMEMSVEKAKEAIKAGHT